MGTLRNFAYDDPNYTLTRVQNAPIQAQDVASAAAFAQFRSRAATIVHHVILEVTSVASAAKVIFTLNRNNSVNTTFTLVSCTSLGAQTSVSVNVTLLSLNDYLSLKHDEVGEYRVIYEYNVIPGQSLYTVK